MDLDELNSEIILCRKCPRLVEWREQVAREKRRAYRDQEYWGRPVPGFGDPHAKVWVVGLAPAAHGSNRTGRAFTGDGSGRFMYPALHRAGFANQPDAERVGDGLTLTNLYISAVVRCAPPANKPLPSELESCRPYLEREMELLQPKVVVALGKIAFDRVLRLYSVRDPSMKFGHGAFYRLPHEPHSPWLLSSYHPSLQNTQTGKLTPAMFDAIWEKARALAE